jgi:preprotein translocase subunit SecG
METIMTGHMLNIPWTMVATNGNYSWTYDCSNSDYYTGGRIYSHEYSESFESDVTGWIAGFMIIMACCFIVMMLIIHTLGRLDSEQSTDINLNPSQATEELEEKRTSETELILVQNQTSDDASDDRTVGV